MAEARDRILARLRATRTASAPAPQPYRKALGWDIEQRVSAFTERMQAVRGEVHRLERSTWVRWLVDHLPQRGLRRALIGRGGAVAEQFLAEAGQHFAVRAYDRPIEEWKSELFDDIDFALTSTYGGLAESGSLVLWPDADEPRLMSLVPPVHVAVLEVSRLFDNFAALLGEEHWAAKMPTNALLISGPSKTADIEQTLAFGIHGPKQLITLLID
jgi:L-lactate dehydrogenase complex protein LldG